jgi:hypothetical protein
MTDRATCYLQIWGVATRETMDQIYHALSDHHDISQSEIRESFEDQAPHELTLYDVSGCSLSPRAESLIRSVQHLGMIFENEQCHEYAPNVEIYDPETKLYANYPIQHGRIMINIDDIDKQDKIEHARNAQRIIDDCRKKPLIVVNSSHDLIEVAAKHPDYAKIAETLA